MSLVLQVAVLLVVFLYLWKTTKKSTPGSPPLVAGAWPVIGHIVPMVRDPLTFFRNARKNHGPVYAFKFMWRKVIVVAAWELYPEYFRAKENELSFEKFTTDLGINRALFGMDSAKYTNFNTVLFKKIMGENYGDSIKEEIERCIDQLPDEGTLDLKAFARRTVCNVTSQLVFSTRLNEELCESILQFEQDTNTIIFLGAFLPQYIVRKYMMTKLDKRRDALIKEICRHIATARANPASQSNYLKKAFDTPEEPMDDETVTLTALGAFIAAVINTANATANVLSFMADYPHTLEGLNLEDGNILTNPELQKWIMECSRMSAGFLGSLRIATNDFEIGGYTIRKGDWSLVERNVHFFDNPNNVSPNQFIPERWTQKGNEQYLYNIQNWGAGVHTCPGKFFALAEMKFMLSEAVKKLHIMPAEKPEPGMRFHVIESFYSQTSQWKRSYSKKK